MKDLTFSDDESDEVVPWREGTWAQSSHPPEPKSQAYPCEMENNSKDNAL